MISLYTLRRIGDLVRAIADGEIKAEVVRQVLAEKLLFEPYSAFKRVSKFTSNVTSLNIIDFLEENGLMIDRREAYALIRMFDQNADGKLSFTEFLNAILPMDDPILRKDATVRPNFKLYEGERLPYEVEYGLMRVFEEELKAFHACERIRRELALYDDFSLIDAFKEMDIDNFGYLDMTSIAVFMDRIGKPMDDAELKAFMRKLDKDADGKIAYTEFLDGFYSSDAEKTVIESEYDNYNPRARYTSPKRTYRTVETKDDEYMGYLRKAYTSPKRRSVTKQMARSMDNFYTASPAKKLSFEEEDRYRTPTKRSSAKKYDDLSASRMSASKKSPLKARDEEEFVKVLKEIIDYNRTVEAIKNDLALRKDFNLFNAFNVFDTHRRGYINSKELMVGLEKFQVYPTKDELMLVLKRIDVDQDGLIRFNEFSDLITPVSVEFAKLMATRQPLYVEDDEDEREVFSIETLLLFERFWKTLYNGELMVESMKQKLNMRPLFSILDAFKTLDKYDQGYITKEEFKNILEDYGIFVTQKDVQSLVDRCEKDLKGVGKVTYTDFLREMSPKSMVSY